jgi:hypothetical protein
MRCTGLSPEEGSMITLLPWRGEHDYPAPLERGAGLSCYKRLPDLQVIRVQYLTVIRGVQDYPVITGWCRTTTDKGCINIL